MLLWNLILGLTWVAITATFTAGNLLLGLALGWLVLAVARPPSEGRSYTRKLRQSLAFLGYFAGQLVLSALRVAWDVATPDYNMRPAILAIPLDARTDAEITLLANLITLTPGTLSLDVSEDRSTLYVHAMYVSDPERLKREIKTGFERRVLELLR